MRVEHYRILRDRPGRKRVTPTETAPTPPHNPTPEQTQEAEIRPPRGSRFVAPVRLTDEQKQQIVQALGQSRIGDEESRILFAGAAEYELAALRRYGRFDEPRTGEPPKAPAGPVLSGLRAAAEEVLEQLSNMPAERLAALENRTAASPKRAREGWVLLLRCELARLARNCEGAPQVAAPPAGPELPRVDPSASRRFTASLARTFEECFDQKTSSEDGAAAFRLALDLITSVTGFRLAGEENAAPARTRKSR